MSAPTDQDLSSLVEGVDPPTAEDLLAQAQALLPTVKLPPKVAPKERQPEVQEKLSKDTDKAPTAKGQFWKGKQRAKQGSSDQSSAQSLDKGAKMTQKTADNLAAIISAAMKQRDAETPGGDLPTSDQIDALSQKSSALEDEVAELKDSLSTALATIAELQADQALMQTSVTGLQHELSKLKASVDQRPLSKPPSSLKFIPASIVPPEPVPKTQRSHLPEAHTGVIIAPKPLDEGPESSHVGDKPSWKKKRVIE